MKNPTLGAAGAQSLGETAWAIMGELGDAVLRFLHQCTTRTRRITFLSLFAKRLVPDGLGHGDLLLPFRVFLRAS